MHPIVEELIAGTFMMTLFGALLAFFYWAITGNNPWPYIVLAEVGALGFGVVLMALCGPRRRD
jgi:hypothetical protein